MRPILKLLPWAFVSWLARRHCERFNFGGELVVRPFANGPVLSVERYGPNALPSPTLSKESSRHG